VSGLIPASSLVRNVNQEFIDPTLRDAQGVTENALQGLPGYSQTIPPKVDREGQPIQMDSGLRRFAVPFRTTEDKSDDPLFSRAVISFDRQTLVPRRLELDERSGVRRTLTLSRVRTNATVSRSEFVFEVPNGVRVVDR